VRRQVSIKSLLADEGGATAVEYGIICGMIAVVIVGMMAVGGGLTVTYNKLIAVVMALGGSSSNSGT
jgi:pilus assembly protein Flp/PilA